MQVTSIPSRALLLAALLGVACSSGPAAPSPGARADARNLARTLASDSATSTALERVDRMVGEQRPVAAAEQLRSHAIPACERTLRAIRAVAITTAEGRVLKDMLLDTYARRIAAMRAYADQLATTEETIELLEALRAHRRREEQTARAMLEVESTARGEQPPPPTSTKLTPPRAGETR
ncbi:MAG: hypothetical protein IT379_42490 [Deltaproteobacteria bacterium]|nr:hypothetical protein [Deltaproteobacteria bacterium]